MGQSPAHDREQCLERAGERRRRRKHQADDAGAARDGLLQSARGRLAEAPPRSIGHELQANPNHHGESIQAGDRRSIGCPHGSDAGQDDRGAGHRRRRAARPVRSCHRGSHGRAAVRARHSGARAREHRSVRAGGHSRSPARAQTRYCRCRTAHSGAERADWRCRRRVFSRCHAQRLVWMGRLARIPDLCCQRGLAGGSDHHRDGF